MILVHSPSTYIEGYMKEEYTSDGVHPYAKDAALFAQWLCQQISGGR